MKKVLFPILALVLVFGLALPMATPAMAAEITNPPTAHSGAWTNGGNAFSSNDQYATINTHNVAHRFWGYGFALGTDVIDKVEVGIEAYTTSNEKIQILVSWGGGAAGTWSGVTTYDPLPTIDPNTVTWFDFTGVTSWTAEKLSDSNFIVEVNYLKDGTALVTYLDWIPVRVTHSPAEPEELEADLSITKSGPEYALVGDEITYTYEVENAGPDSATNVAVEDDVAGTAAYVSGDDGDGELDVGETWIFEASYTVLEGDPDPLENTATVSSDTSDPDEENNEASWSVDILHPGLDVTKEADKTITKEGDTVRFTITVENTGDVTLNLVSFTDTLKGDIKANFSATLAAGAKESWYYDRATLAGDPDPLANEAEAHYSITGLPNDITDKSKVEVDLIARICGYKFHDANANEVWDNGEVGLEGWTIELWLAGSKIAETTTGSDGSYCFDELDAGDYAVKEVGQKNWMSTTPNSLDVTLQSGEISEDNNFGNARLVTRTQGFWSTHKAFTWSKWTTETIGTKTINTQPRLFGGFWSNIAKKTTGAKRTALDQARMQLVQQLLATMLNVKAFGDDGLGTGAGLIAAGKAAFAGTDRATILDIANKLDAFNKSGDTQPLPPGVIPGPADPKGAQKIADKVFWDTLP